MQTHAEIVSLVPDSPQPSPVVKVSKAQSGYSISKGGPARQRADMGELVATGGCLFFATLSLGHWLVPQATVGAEILPYQISGTILFFGISALLLIIARRGLTSEVQIDTERKVLRVVRRNRKGAITVMSHMRFAEIGSVYIKRSKSEDIANQMFVRSKPGAMAILIASGPAHELEPLLGRLQNDFRGPVAMAVIRQSQPIRVAKKVVPRRVFIAG